MSTTIALDLGGTIIKMALVREGKLLAVEEIPVPANEALAPFLPVIEGKVSFLAKSCGVSENNISGIGMAFPSIVDHRKGKILSEYVKYCDVNDLNLQDWASGKWGIPLLLENDARAALAGEWQYGAGMEKTDLVQVTIGTGFGSAVLIDNKILRGKHSLAGNLGGHITIKYDGEPCNCGNVGCLESVASTWALPGKIKRHELFESSRLKQEPRLDFEAIFRLAAQNDELAGIVRDDAVKAWGFGVINLVHAYDPEVVIIGGGIMKSKDFILPCIQKMVDEHTWLPAGTVEITAARNHEHSALLGMDYLIKRTDR